METKQKTTTHYQPKSASKATLVTLVHTAWGDIVKRKPKLTEDDYRAALRRATNNEQDSCEHMTIEQLDAVMAVFRAPPFNFRRRHKNKTTAKGKAPRQPKSRALDTSAEASKVRAIWLHLHQLGGVDDPNEAALAKWVKRQTGVDALDWVDGPKMEKLIEAAKAWRVRVIGLGVATCPACGQSGHPVGKVAERLADQKDVFHCQPALAANSPMVWSRTAQ